MSDYSETAREYMDCWNRRDWNRYREMLHTQYSYTGGDGVRQQGADAGLAVGQMFATGFPDGRIDVEKIHSAGDTVIVEFIGRGTHNGELMGYRATGRAVTIPVCNVLEFRDGKIYAERQYPDMAHMMRQLGLIQETPVAASSYPIP